jgi:hypothetical protein
MAEAAQGGGERVVFDALAATPAGAADGWTVLHSLHLADRRRQFADAIDFLCVVPGKGVLVLEVKGCHALRHSDGDWFYGDDPEPDPCGPFRHASDAARGLRERLVKQHRQYARIPFWSAVCFPFLDFKERSPKWHAWQVIDRRALRAQPIALLVEGALDRARALLIGDEAEWFHPERHEPSPAQCATMVEALRPDFELVRG